MPRRRDLPDDLTHGPFSRRQAKAAGVSDDMLRSGRFDRPFHGVRAQTWRPDELEQRCLALATVVPRAVVSHETAAMLHGLPLPAGALTGVLVVTTPPAVRAPRRSGVRGHRGDLTGYVQAWPSGLHVVDPAACLAQLSAALGLADLVALGDAALAAGMATVTDLTRTLGDRRFRRGRRVRREALELLDARSGSPMESRLRVVLVLAGLPKPEVNRDVVTDGEWLARPDLSYPELKIAIEYEGDHHRTDRRQWQRDKARRRLLEDAGWLVIEVTADDVYRRPDLLVARIRSAITHRTPKPLR
jgi:very-short-patch-repair endonuclease